MKKNLVKVFGWSLFEIDETDMTNLLAFIAWKDPNTKVINGKEYRRATNTPKWL